jgi:prepilin-type N-terminal cleavage/methylation domain-containing protein/prepilin-type processing-associated H-X9-DG protein
MNIANKQKDELIKTANKQYGYFTSFQAKRAGYQANNFSYHIKRNNWIKIHRGLFRLTGYEDSIESTCTRWTLWSRNKNEQPQGIISHFYALYFYKMIHQEPKYVDLTVPKDFQKWKIPTEELTIHKDNLPLSALENHGSFMTTKLFRTLQDTKEELENIGKWNEVADKAVKGSRLSESELSKLGILKTNTKILNSTGNNYADELSLGEIGQAQRDEAYYRMQDAKRIFDSMQRGVWSMNTSPLRSRKFQQRGFTLVELLVVIAIISILAGMLLPALENAIGVAKSTRCMNSEKQFALAISIYADDYQGWTPTSRYHVGADPYANPGWGGYLYRYDYIEDPYIWICPSAEDYQYAGHVVKYVNLSGKDFWNGAFDWIVYGINQYYSLENTTRLRPKRTKLHQTYKPSSTVLLSDSYCGSPINPGTPMGREYLCYPVSNATNISNFMDPRHNNGANTAWADGHCTWEEDAWLHLQNKKKRPWEIIFPEPFCSGIVPTLRLLFSSALSFATMKEMITEVPIDVKVNFEVAL